MLARRIILLTAVVVVVSTALWSAQHEDEVKTTSSSATPATTTTRAALSAAGVASAARPATTGATAAPAPSGRGPAPAPPPPPPGLGIGSRGPEVLALEQRLNALHYDPGPIDGVFDSSTAFAVVAFQKVTGMARTGRATDDVIAALQTATDPPPLVPGGGAERVEIDVARQVLFLYLDDALWRILPVSTGFGGRYCVDGSCDRAVTPAGSYHVFERQSGWQTSRLGRLYNPLYFNGGIAIHGSLSVPPYPASHGCVRIPMYEAVWFPSKVPDGTPVYVKNGPTAPVPFNQPAPDGTPPAPPSSSSPAPPSSSSPAPPATSPPPPDTTTTSSTTTTTRPGSP
ncbi:MAG: murein L,D-transpeptidase [Acidimicrobiia bacterium]|nr:murein L,D-transpeptidase [Acidimicrobiia bacterium]